MAIICEELGLLFTMVPRTGCSAIGRHLLSDFGGRWLPEEDIKGEDGRLRVPRKHSSLQQLVRHGVLSDEHAASLFKVSTVRNPFDSLVSLYVKRRDTRREALDSPDHWTRRSGARKKDIADFEYCRSHSFPQWIRKRTFLAAGAALFGYRRPTTNQRYAEGIDHVMRFESLQEDFDRVLQRLGRSGSEIPIFNRTSGRERDYRSYYTKLSRRLVEQVFKKDLREFGYSF